MNNMKLLKENIKEFGLVKKYDSYLVIWDKIQTIEELFYCNVEFIKGNICGTPYHFGPLNIDSIPLINDLIKLHDYGFLSTGGQGSLMEYDKWCDKSWINQSGTQCGKWFYSIEQKSYISGYIKNDNIDTLVAYFESLNCDSIFNNGDKIFYYVNSCNKKITNIDLQHNLTRTKSYKTIEDKDYVEWEYPTNIWTNDEYDNMLDFKEWTNILPLIKNKYAFVYIAMNNYGSSVSVETILLNYFATNK